MIVDYDGMKIRIPKGYAQTEDGTFVNGHGVEYALVTYGRGGITPQNGVFKKGVA